MKKERAILSNGGSSRGKSKLNKKNSILSNIHVTNQVMKASNIEGTRKMAAKEKIGNTVFSWTAPKGLLTLGFFIAVAFVSEFFMVSFFMGSGLTETSAPQFPISLLFHILPLAVIIVLVLSWTYLTKHVAMRPQRKAPTKTTKSRSYARRRSHKPKTSVVGSIKNALDKIGSTFSSGDNSAMIHRRTFGSVVFESGVTVLVIFMLALILLVVLVYPRLFTDFAVEFYSKTSGLQGFLQSLAEVAVSIAGGLDFIASGFRSAFEGLLSSSSSSLTGGDLLWRYVFVQNAAAWVSAIYVLVYVRYFSKTYSGSK